MKITKSHLLEMVDQMVFNVVTEHYDISNEDYMGFDKLTKKLSSKGAKNPKALAAWIGKKKYGKKKMAQAAKKGTSLRGKQ